eukprot:CAMPEP_0182435622 /NCGR_PEP_ID=MMETSP1167-20130531/76803_1 /TAXON_ID=2988 /ORGANISM="Mallomonas Sp, Strain CCMP3275" /LENGTH=87 /DNA_ID=CAMNT_0024626867 /DNA_START=53 /DNA_END=313 /DNA_ORIENTATION=+
MKSVVAKVTTPKGVVIDIPPVSVVETASYFRQYLIDHFITCGITNYRLDYNDGKEWIKFNEFVELANYIKSDEDEEKMDIRMVLEDY